MTTIPLNEQSSSSSLVQDPSGTLPTTCNAPVISKSTCVPSDRDATIPAEVPQSSPDLKPHPDTCTSNSQLVGKWIDSVCNVTQTESQQTQEGDLVVVEDTHPTAYHPYCGHQTSATRDEVSSSISTCSSLPWMSRVRKSMLQTPKDGESASGKDNDDDDETNEDIDEMTSCASSSTTYSTAASSSQRAGSVASTTTHSTKSHALSPSDLVIDFEPIVLQGTRIDASVVQTEDEKVEMFRILRNSRSEHPVGVIYKVLSDVAVIRVLQGAPILDVGSVMCLESGMLLGRVTTLFGPIAACFYAVWLPNASEGLHDISFTTKADALIPGTSVFTLPDYNVVIASEEEIALCRKIPGTDASYVDDQELPEDMRPDFSDDEKEREWKHERKRRTTHRAAICGQGIIPNSTLRTPLCGEVSSVTSDDVSVEFDEDGEVKNLLVRSKRKGEKESPRERGGAEIYRFASTKMMSGKRGRTARGRGNFQ